MGEVVTIGFIRRPHGLSGEVVVTDLTEGFFEPGPGLEVELVGLAVETTAGDDAGKVVGVYAAGPHDVLTIEAGDRTFDVPFVKAHVADVQRGIKIVITPYGEE